MDKLFEGMRANPTSVRFADLAKVCEHYFGEPRQGRQFPPVPDAVAA